MSDALIEIKNLLDEKYFQFNNPSFIETDPISIPHQFSKKEDIEVSAYLMATIAWGNRTSIINNGNKLMALMNQTPHDFVLNFSKKDELRFQNFVHRTFNSNDCIFFLQALKHLYKNHGGLEHAFSDGFNKKDENVKTAISNFAADSTEKKWLCKAGKTWVCPYYHPYKYYEVYDENEVLKKTYFIDTVPAKLPDGYVKKLKQYDGCPAHNKPKKSQDAFDF